MPIAPGTKPGHYEVIELLGADGIGEVYLHGNRVRSGPCSKSIAALDTYRRVTCSSAIRSRERCSPSGHPAYDVSPDGERFLMIQDTEDERTQINVVFTWFEELERLVPTP